MGPSCVHAYVRAWCVRVCVCAGDRRDPSTLLTPRSRIGGTLCSSSVTTDTPPWMHTRSPCALPRYFRLGGAPRTPRSICHPAAIRKPYEGHKRAHGIALTYAPSKLRAYTQGRPSSPQSSSPSPSPSQTRTIRTCSSRSRVACRAI